MEKSLTSNARKAKIFSLFLLLALVGGGGAFFLWQREKLGSEEAVVLERFQAERSLLGEVARVTVYAESAEAAELAFASAFARGEEVERVTSRSLPGSEVNRFNDLEGEVWFEASEDLLTLVAYGLELADLTEGAYDPTLGTLTELWRGSKESGQLPTTEALDRARGSAGAERVELDLERGRIRKLKGGLQLDLTGSAKGYAGDVMLEVLRRHQIRSAMVSIGSDVRCGSAPPGQAGWTMGLRNLAGEMVAEMTVADCAVATSGDWTQFVEIAGKRYSHIVDPWSGLGATDSLVATVVAKNGLMADPLATAACVNPLFFRDISSSTEIHSRIVSSQHQQLSGGFPPLAPRSQDGSVHGGQ